MAGNFDETNSGWDEGGIVSSDTNATSSDDAPCERADDVTDDPMIGASDDLPAPAIPDSWSDPGTSIPEQIQNVESSASAIPAFPANPEPCESVDGWTWDSERGTWISDGNPGLIYTPAVAEQDAPVADFYEDPQWPAFVPKFKPLESHVDSPAVDDEETSGQPVDTSSGWNSWDDTPQTPLTEEQFDEISRLEFEGIGNIVAKSIDVEWREPTAERIQADLKNSEFIYYNGHGPDVPKPADVALPPEVTVDSLRSDFAEIVAAHQEEIRATKIYDQNVRDKIKSLAAGVITDDPVSGDATEASVFSPGIPGSVAMDREMLAAGTILPDESSESTDEPIGDAVDFTSMEPRLNPETGKYQVEFMVECDTMEAAEEVSNVVCGGEFTINRRVGMNDPDFNRIGILPGYDMEKPYWQQNLIANRDAVLACEELAESSLAGDVSTGSEQGSDKNSRYQKGVEHYVREQTRAIADSSSEFFHRSEELKKKVEDLEGQISLKNLRIEGLEQVVATHEASRERLADHAIEMLMARLPDTIEELHRHVARLSPEIREAYLQSVEAYKAVTGHSVYDENGRKVMRDASGKIITLDATSPRPDWTADSSDPASLKPPFASDLAKANAEKEAFVKLVVYYLTNIALLIVITCGFLAIAESSTRYAYAFGKWIGSFFL